MANDMKWEIKEDNRPLVIMASKKQVQNGLNAIGATAATHAKRGCPVDTGRLRNSISFASATKHAGQNGSSGAKASMQDYALKGIPAENEVYIGTNVEYAAIIEYADMAHKTGGAHYLKNAAANHSEEYKKIMEAALKA